jgi:uncharacterized membrane protein
MATTKSGDGAGSTNQEERTPEEIQGDIEQTRRELGDTAAALAEKADPKKQAKRKVSEVKAKASAKKDEVASKASAAKEDVAAKVTEAGAEDQDARQANQFAQRAGRQASQAARENPVPTAAAAGFAAGIIVGWIVGRR